VSKTITENKDVYELSGRRKRVSQVQCLTDRDHTATMLVCFLGAEIRE